MPSQSPRVCERRSRAAWLVSSRSKRVADRFESQIEKANDQGVEARIRDDWKIRNEEFRIEIAKCESAHSEFRRLLQWLTGELWS